MKQNHVSPESGEPLDPKAKIDWRMRLYSFLVVPGVLWMTLCSKLFGFEHSFQAGTPENMMVARALHRREARLIDDSIKEASHEFNADGMLAMIEVMYLDDHLKVDEPTGRAYLDPEITKQLRSHAADLRKKITGSPTPTHSSES